MKAREIQEKIKKEWLQKPNLTETELEYLNNYFYDDDYYYLVVIYYILLINAYKSTFCFTTKAGK